jgi:hypothetical protein
MDANEYFQNRAKQREFRKVYNDVRDLFNQQTQSKHNPVLKLFVRARIKHDLNTYQKIHVYKILINLQETIII